MTDQSKYGKEFTAEDIDRYYSGKMSTLEMHQLEKAAMEDPFLADALEGYTYTQTPTEDRAWLRGQLQTKTEGAKVVPVKGLSRNQFLRIAALFILLIGCGWAVYQLGFKTKGNELVLTKTPEYKTSSPRKDSTLKDPSLTNTDANANSHTEAPHNEADDSNPNTQTTTVEHKGNGTVALSTQNRHTGKIDDRYLAKPKNQNDELTNIRQGKIAGADKEEASSMVNSRKRESEIPKDPDSTKEKQAESDNKDYVATAPSQTVTPGKDNVIVLQRNKNAEPIPEVVLGRSMKDSNYRKPLVTFEEAVPEKGSKYFDDYIAQNLQLPEEELKKNISGEVKLSFDVNESGDAVNIAIVKSLCTDCDKEAIRLLQQGPKWVKKKNARKGTVSIKF